MEEKRPCSRLEAEHCSGLSSREKVTEAETLKLDRGDFETDRVATGKCGPEWIFAAFWSRPGVR